MRCAVFLCCAVLLLAIAPRSSAAEPADVACGTDGRVHVAVDGREWFTLSPVAADGQWKFGSPTAETATDADPLRFTLPLGKERLAGELVLGEQAGSGQLAWSFTADQALSFNSLGVSADFSVASLAGTRWTAGSRTGVFPMSYGETQLMSGLVTSFALVTQSGQQLALTFAKPTTILLQDNRRWGATTFVLHIGQGIGKLAPSEPATLDMQMSIPGGVHMRRDLPLTIVAGADWVPLNTLLDIIPGSALDLSHNDLIDGPCGAKGRIIATADGHFAYADEPHIARRFYGVNLCFSAQYLSKEQADILLDRLVRLGYNSVRIHHYEFGLTKPDWQPDFVWDAERVDRLDYLMAGCAKRGLWLTTDLYVSRPVPGKQIGLAGDAPNPNQFKLLVGVYEPAYQDWVTFARKFLDRVNPYTGKRLADDPTLAWVSLVNEGWNGSYDAIRKSPPWTVAWNRWLANRYPERSALAAALGDLTDKEDPVVGTMALPAEIADGVRRGRLCQVFLADVERMMYERMRGFLRDELKCQALLTNLNCGFHTLLGQTTRAGFDYVDEHFYVDHPEFLAAQWHLPSHCSNTNPVRDGASGANACAGERIWGRPFTISEFNYSGPGRFRGVGGVLTGAMAALQDWDAVWRFAYGHKAEALFTPAPIDYFNLANDPLNQAADRAAILLYLRRDLQPAAHAVALALPGGLLRELPAQLPPPTTCDWLAWTTRIGCTFPDLATKVPANAVVVPLRGSEERTAVAAQVAVTLPVTTADVVIRAETGEVQIDAKQGVLTIDTPRTAGGYADPGQIINAAKAGVRISDLSVGATVFVSSLDATPIREAKRLLVTHLTDLQNSGAQYSESACQNLLAWGDLPHLVHDGAAIIHLTLSAATTYHVWALATNGQRLEPITTTVADGVLTFTARVRGPDGARMLYEVTSL